MQLNFTRNFNPRVAVAVARYLEAPVELIYRPPHDPHQVEEFRKLNPNLEVPVLIEGDQVLWETDAVSCRLSQIAESEFWRTCEALPLMLRWLSWGTHNFVFACDMVHFERVTRPRYNHGWPRQDRVEEGFGLFATSAPILDKALAGKKWLLGDEISYADFRMATVLPYADVAGLSLQGFPNIEAWYARLEEIDAWRDPFAGLNVPPLPPIPRQQTR